MANSVDLFNTLPWSPIHITIMTNTNDLCTQYRQVVTSGSRARVLCSVVLCMGSLFSGIMYGFFVQWYYVWGK